MSDSKQQTRAESVDAAYRQRLGNLEASEAKDAADIEEADNLEHDVHELNDEQKFVGGVDVKKDAESEEDFLPTPSADETVDKDETVDLRSTEEPVEEKPAPAKKTAAKK